jgi:hypothetical protein
VVRSDDFDLFLSIQENTKLPIMKYDINHGFVIGAFYWYKEFQLHVISFYFLFTENFIRTGCLSFPNISSFIYLFLVF